MAAAPEPFRVLKRGHAREVLLEQPGDGAEPAVVKRFHHPRPWLALADGRRARREHALLRHLHARGVAVPEPLGVRRGAAGWELRMRWIPGAEPLERWLAPARHGEPPPGGWRALLDELARLLAGTLAAGVLHRDLHAGNVLVDPHGRPWLVDFHGARRRRVDLAARGGRELLEASLVRWAAIGRETLGPRARLRFLAAFRAALPPSARPALDALAARGPELEQRAREERRALVAHGAGRWLRPSSRVEVHAAAGVQRLVRRGLVLAGGDVAPRPGEALHVLRPGHAREAEARWLVAARLEEHGIPAFVPLLLERGPAGARLVLGRPAEAVPAPDPTPAERAGLDALLADRGLALDPRAPHAFHRARSGLVLESAGALLARA